MIITLSGEIGAGKDTFAEILVDALGVNGYTAKIVKFAQPMKDTIALLGIPDDREAKELVRLYDIPYDKMRFVIEHVFQYMPLRDRNTVADTVWQKMVDCKKQFSSRQFQQWLGCARDIRQDYFIHHLKQSCAANENTIFVVSDCRFINEAEQGDTHVHVLRADNPLRVSTSHVSEQSLSKLEERAEFLVHNEEREDWREVLEDKAHYVVHTIGWRGYVDEKSY